jgi:hypothetical protein
MINCPSHKTITIVLKQYIFRVTKYIIHNLYYMKKGFYMSHPRGGARRHGDPRLISGVFFVCVKELVLWSRHLVFWSLETLTGLSEILRQGTGCVRGRY